MTTKLDSVDVLIVGLGWTGGIIANYPRMPNDNYPRAGGATQPKGIIR